MAVTIDMIPEYNTVTFKDLYPDDNTFIYSGTFQDSFEVVGYIHSPLPQTISTDSARTLYYLLYSRYGNNPIANRDINQFMIKLFTIIWQYGPAWEKRLDIQKQIRELKPEELEAGSKTIINHAYNPSSEASTQSLEDLNYINDQNVQNFKRGRAESLLKQWSMIETDVSEDFIKRFRYLFKTFVQPEQTLLYETTYQEE